MVNDRTPTADRADLLRPRHHWDPADVRRWLSYLAQQQHGDRDLLWWHLARRTFTSQTVGRVSKLALGVVVGLTTWGAIGWWAGLVIALVAGLAALMTEESTTGGLTSEPGYANFRLRGRRAALAHSLKTNWVSKPPIWMGMGMATALWVGLWTGQVLGLWAGLGIGLFSGLVAGLGIWLAFGLAEWAEMPTTTDRAGTPNSTHHGDRTLLILRVGLVGLVSGSGIGLAFGLGLGLRVELRFGLGLGLRVGLTFGLCIGLVFGIVAVGMGSRAWLSYIIAARWLAITGRLPWRLLTFLEDAYWLGLLRIAGPAYQFRHAQLQDHLAVATVERTRERPPAVRRPAGPDSSRVRGPAAM